MRARLFHTHRWLDAAFRQRVLVVAACCCCLWCGWGCTRPEGRETTPPEADSLQTTFRVLAEGLNVPWEVLWGNDDALWVTNHFPNSIIRLDPATMARDTFWVQDSALDARGEHFIMGLAQHPGFPEEPFVYVSHNYLLPDRSSVMALSLKRYQLDRNSKALVEPRLIVEGVFADDSMLPGGRVKVVQDSLLLLATSDENDHNLQSRDTASLSGKWLCFDLEGHPVQASAHLPAPLYAQGVRNAQGLAETDRGALFFCDHGPSNDDELNRLTPGGDYGWPDIRGFCDAPDETPFCTINHKVDPTVAWTPTIAPGSVAYYGHSRYPDLTNSLLLATLKESDLRVLTLNEQHTEVVAETVLFNNQFGRIRDIAVSDDGRIFLATANQIPEDNPYYIPVATQGLTYDVLVEVMVGSEARQ